MTKKIFALLAVVALTGIVAGCALFGSWQDTAGKTLASISLTTDAAMKGWAKWVVDGHATSGDEAKVKAGYEKYQTALRIAKSAYSEAVTVNNKQVWDNALPLLSATSSEVQTTVATAQNK